MQRRIHRIFPKIVDYVLLRFCPHLRELSVFLSVLSVEQGPQIIQRGGRRVPRREQREEFYLEDPAPFAGILEMRIFKLTHDLILAGLNFFIFLVRKCSFKSLVAERQNLLQANHRSGCPKVDAITLREQFS